MGKILNTFDNFKFKNFLLKLIQYSSIFSSKKLDKIYFDSSISLEINLMHPSNHWGDILFFGPLIESFHRRGIKFSVKDRFNFLSSIYVDDLNINPDITIIREPSFFIKNNGKYLVNFYDFPCQPIAKSLYEAFSSDNYNFYETDKFNFKNKLLKASNESILIKEIDFLKNYLVYSPGINSRKYGFYPNRKKIIYDISTLLKSFCAEGVPIVLIGDAESKKFGYRFTDNSLVFDLSGRTSWQDLVAILNRPNSLGLVSFDNFPYHLSTLIGSKNFLFSKSWLCKAEYSWIKNRYMPAF